MSPRPTIHVAILLNPYIDLILSGRKTIESRLTITARPPYRAIAAGDVIYFKASSGCYRARAVAERVEFHENLTVTKLRELFRLHNCAICGAAEYWRLKRNSRYATFIWLREVVAVEDGPRIAPSRGPAWFVLGPDAGEGAMSKTMLAKENSFTVTLTAGALRNGYVVVPRAVHEFPRECYGGRKASEAGQSIVVELPDGLAIKTDVIAGVCRLRWRGWKAVFERCGVKAGDELRFTRVAERRYRVEAGALKPSRLSGGGRGQGEGSSTSSEISTLPKKQGALTPSLSQRERGSELSVHDFVEARWLRTLIQQAQREDMGPRSTDLTGQLMLDASTQAVAQFRARVPGMLCGAALLPYVIKQYDPSVVLTSSMTDGAALSPGDVIATLRGPLRSIVALERVALNFMTHLSGIASLTARYVERVRGTKAGIFDTRKTIPGLRGLAKYAVVCGGGRNHRMGLYDAVLVKDNHIAHIPLDKLGPAVAELLRRAGGLKPRPRFVQIEVDTLAQLDPVLRAGPDIVLLDNMPPEQLRQAVALRDRIAPRVELEASGGVNLDTVRAIAEAGVDRISIGALTHSAPTLDIGLDIG